MRAPATTSTSVARYSSEVRSTQCRSSTTSTSGLKAGEARLSSRSASKVRALITSG
jgi:hypothetical protein